MLPVEPTAAVPIIAPDPVESAILTVIGDYPHRSIVPASKMDSLVALIRRSPTNWEVNDTLDFNGDGHSDWIIGSPSRMGTFGTLYLRNGDDFELSGTFEGQEFAVCYLAGRSAVIHTIIVVGTRFEVHARDFKVEPGGLTEVWSESFSINNGEDGWPREQADRARQIERANALRARTVGPPHGCAFRCGFGGCCNAGSCPPDRGIDWEPY